MRLVSLAFVTIAACGSSNNHHQDDAGMRPIDAMTDGAVAIDAASVTPAAELIPAGGRLTGGGFTMDVVVGAGVSPRPANGGSTSVQTNSSIKP